MLTVADLKTMPRGMIFAEGLTIDSPKGLKFANSGRALKWVAVRGGWHDWAVYVDLADVPADKIAKSGDKVGMAWVRKLIACDTGAFKLYRR